MPTGVRYLPKFALISIVCLIISHTSFASATNLTHQKFKDFTEIRLITPYTVEGLNPKVSIAKKVKGECWTTSTSNASRPNTWRCQAEHQTYDPCFINPIKPDNSVICLNDPWSNHAVEITVNAPLPTTKHGVFDHKSAQPWALELANGNHCTLMTGPSLLIDGMKASYQCKGAVVYGDIDRSNGLWSVLYQAHNSLSMDQTHVVSAWY